MDNEEFDRTMRRPLLRALGRQARRSEAAFAPEDTRLRYLLPSIREDAEDLVGDHDGEECDAWTSCAGHDALRMLDAVEELLELHDDRVTGIITRHLTGGGEDGV